MRTLCKFICLLAVLVLGLCLEKAWSTEIEKADIANTQDCQFTFDTNKYWKIYISLVGEERGNFHKAEAIVEDANTVTVLYPGDRKSVTYPIKQVRSIMFFHRLNKTGSIWIFNNK